MNLNNESPLSGERAQSPEAQPTGTSDQTRTEETTGGRIQVRQLDPASSRRVLPGLTSGRDGESGDSLRDPTKADGIGIRDQSRTLGPASDAQGQTVGTHSMERPDIHSGSGGHRQGRTISRVGPPSPGVISGGWPDGHNRSDMGKGNESSGDSAASAPERHHDKAAPLGQISPIRPTDGSAGTPALPEGSSNTPMIGKDTPRHSKYEGVATHHASRHISPTEQNSMTRVLLSIPRSQAPLSRSGIAAHEPHMPMANSAGLPAVLPAKAGMTASFLSPAKGRTLFNSPDQTRMTGDESASSGEGRPLNADIYPIRPVTYRRKCRRPDGCVLKAGDTSFCDRCITPDL
ncbi:hypothetical protein [Rhizobium rhizoryzae]|uniref:hypothetical protein n=1 Tax=Rhizobium rhizoryzae TaxID=451876 RepID=UPI00289CEEB1|nr:hypothetical protein [Rhizobium rhizoryzae]